MEKIYFTVDAALIQELGERLIGQPHIALAELIKNSYDADATTCKVIFSDDKIEVNDNGHGMSFDEFSNYWMRIGSTHKLDNRRSKNLNRPLTGSKGIGRLAVQFLAEGMTIETTTQDDPSIMLYGMVDWGKIERGKDLQTVEVDYELRKSENIFPDRSRSGTRITLEGLKEDWSVDRLRELGDQLWALRSPFRRRANTYSTGTPDDFNIEVEAPVIENAQNIFDTTLDTLFASWKARITGSLDRGRANGVAAVSVEFKDDFPEGLKRQRFRHEVQLPVKHSSTNEKTNLDRASFEILVFKLEGRQPGGLKVGEIREYLHEFGNVSIYDAGFRLPYYGMEQDWLEIGATQARRISVSELLPASLRIGSRYMLDLPEPRRIFGVVDINTAHERVVAEAENEAPDQWLQLQPGRDRLHDNVAFEQLRDLVRFSLDFYANRYRYRAMRAIEERREREPPSAKQERALEILDRHRSSIPAPVHREVRREVADALKASHTEEERLDQRAALLAPLASAGMVALSLSHELAREARLLDRAIAELQRIAKNWDAPEITRIVADFKEAVARLNSLQELFAPLLSDTDKAVAERLRVKPVVEQTVRAMSPLVPGIRFDVSGIPDDLRFPIGSFAEWSAILQNLITNAWNAMLQADDRRISFEAGRSRGGKEWLRVSDTGVGLDMPPTFSSKLFEPFERRLAIKEELRSIAIGGQGLGLSIVRMIARRRGADVSFVEPREEFSTTFELTWRS